MPTLDAYVAKYLAQAEASGRLSHGTTVRARYRLRRFSDFFGDRPLSLLGRRQVAAWQETLTGLSAGTRRLHVSTVRGFCRWLTDEGHLRADPTVGLTPVRKPRRVPRALPSDTVRRLLAACGDDRDRLILELMVGLGLRCVEVASLEHGDYDPTAGIVRVVGKGGHERALPVPSSVAAAIAGYQAAYGGRGGPLIASRTTGLPLSAAYVSDLVAAAMRRAGIKRRAYDGISAHALRHTAASDVLEHSHDLGAVQAMLGHANLATTSVYLRGADLGRLREAMEGRDYRST